MKNLLLTTMALACFTCFAQDVPKNVEAAFNKNFAEAENAEWTDEGDLFQVYFFHNDRSKSATFGKTGNLISTKESIEESELPKEVSAAVKKSYASSSYQGIDKVTNDKGETHYVVSMENEKGMYILQVSAAGKILSTDVQEYGEESEEEED